MQSVGANDGDLDHISLTELCAQYDFIRTVAQGQLDHYENCEEAFIDVDVNNNTVVFLYVD